MYPDSLIFRSASDIHNRRCHFEPVQTIKL